MEWGELQIKDMDRRTMPDTVFSSLEAGSGRRGLAIAHVPLGTALVLRLSASAAEDCADRLVPVLK